MKTNTVNGTAVNIISISGNNLVVVDVVGRTNRAQVDASDLIRPEGELPPEFADITFHIEDKKEVAKEELP